MVWQSDFSVSSLSNKERTERERELDNKETRTYFGELQKGELHYQVGDRI